MSDKKQSSIEFLFEKLWNTPKDKFEWTTILQQANEIHREEIIKASARGYINASHGLLPLDDAIDYANSYYLIQYQK